MVVPLIADLASRGLVAQISDRDGLESHVATASRTVYCGFDPTADSLHIGNLVPLLTLARFQRAGHRPIALVGGATGLIGDPSFKQNERALNARDIVEQWVGSIRRQVSRFLDFDGNNAAIVVDNLDWTRDLDVITFLRDIGRHFSVNAMLQKESVRARLTQEGMGISFTEFSYMVLQSMDFVELSRRFDCTVQVGGSDQWGNITAGMDLIRRMLHRDAFALTVPLVTKADGSKFGKTEGGTVWLDEKRTSPYALYQFWLNSADADVERFLHRFTFLDAAEIRALSRATQEAPQNRAGQFRLAEEVTRLVHGNDAVQSAKRITRALFEDRLGDLTVADLDQLCRDGVPVTSIDEAQRSVIAFIVAAELAQSRGAARRLIASRGVSVNGRVIEDETIEMTRSTALFGRFHLVRRGKKQWHLGVHVEH